MAMRESTACPAPEVLAAFVDGRLTGDARRRVAAHLDACADCYELFSETVRFQGEEEPRGRVVTSDRFGSRQWHWPAVAAAAVLILLVLVAVPVLRMDPERPVVATLPGGAAALSAGELVAAIEVADEEALARALRVPEPGGAFGFAPARMDAETAAFRAGVWLVAVRAAARAGDAEAAQVALRELATALEATERADDLEKPLASAAQAAREERLGELEEAATRLEARAAELLEPLPLSLGAWAEAGRLAAALGDEEFFRSAAFLDFQEEIGNAELPEGVPAIVTDVEALTGDGEVDAAELVELERSFTHLTARY